MIEIPRNVNDRSEQIVDELTNRMLTSIREHDWKRGVVDTIGYDERLLDRVLDKFKSKGWYTYKYVRFDGAVIDIRVHATPYEPSRRGLNQVYSY